MRCPTCRRSMMSSSSQELHDDQGAMTITRWRCRPCHETAEEIWVSAGYRGSDSTRIRYAVARPEGRRRPMRPLATGVQAHAGAC